MWSSFRHLFNFKKKIVRFHWIDPYVPKKQQDLRLAVLNKSWWVEIKRSFTAVQHLESIVFHYRKFNILQKRRYVHNWYCMDNCQLGLRLQYWHKISRKTTERDCQSFANSMHMFVFKLKIRENQTMPQTFIVDCTIKPRDRFCEVLFFLINFLKISQNDKRH